MKALLVSFLILTATCANAQKLELIWSEAGLSDSQIYISRYDSGQWQAKQAIVSDGNLNILPAIAIADSGQHLAVWSAVDINSIKLKYSFKQNNNWQPAKILSQDMATNLAPVIVFDKFNKAWVFWSANNGEEDDDIYMSNWSGQSWSPPKRVHPPNQTPDILPEAGLDNAGNIWVSWQAFQPSGYISVSRTFEAIKGNKLSLNHSSKKLAEIAQYKHQSQQSQIPLPAFFKTNGRAALYNPADKNNPTQLLKGNLK